MSILVVDDEDSTRDALKIAFQQIGLGNIIEARNGDEAAKLIEAEKGRLRLIVSDWEMPYCSGVELADRLARNPERNDIPFLLITSDLMPERKVELETSHPRVDGLLMKPFRSRLLDEAVQKAVEKAALRRQTYLWLAPHEPPKELRAAVEAFEQKGQTARQLTTDVSLRDFAGVFVDPVMLKDQSRASEIKKAQAIWPMRWVCLSRDPAHAVSMRSLCEVFIDLKTSVTQNNWQRYLDAFDVKLRTGLKVESLLLEAKSISQKEKWADLKAVGERVLKLDPGNNDAALFLAEALANLGSREAAQKILLAILTANPFLNRAYVRLLESRQGQANTDELAAALAVEEYCPQSPDILLSAAKTLSSAGRLADARRVAEKILALKPEHVAALELLKEFGNQKP